MAKGQKRSNREIGKQKQDKGSPKPESGLSNPIKLVTNSNAARGNGRADERGRRDRWQER
jgi:hypothetical protein